MTVPTPTKATKAIYSGIAATCAAVATVFADGSVTVPEVAIAVGGIVAIVGGVYGVTNTPAEGQ